MILGCEALGVVDVVGELGLVGLFALQAAEALHRRAAVGAVDPDGTDAPLEVGEFRNPRRVRLGHSRATSRQVLTGLAALHELGRSEPPQELCTVGARYQMFAPQIHAADDEPGAHPAREFIITGWNLFAEHAPADIVDAVSAVHHDPLVLDGRLAKYSTTLLHGDAKVPNLGLGPAGLIAIDWGDLTGFGPPEVDVAWYALMNDQSIGTSPDETFADYQDVATRPLEPGAIDLACIGSLAQMGFKLAGYAVRGETPEVRAGASARLTWWCGRVRVALDRTGLA